MQIQVFCYKWKIGYFQLGTDIKTYQMGTLSLPYIAANLLQSMK